MPESTAYRVLEIVRQWFAEMPETITSGLDLRDYTNDLTVDDKPALFVLRGSPGEAGPLGRETDGGIVEPLAVDLVGFVEAATLDDDSEPIIPPAVTLERERYLQAVIRRMYFVDSAPEPYGLSGTQPDSLPARLNHDRAQHGNGAADFVHIASPLTDQGYEPPHGIFELPCRALLHYQDREF